MLRGPRPAAARNPVRTAALPTRLAAMLVVAPLAVIGLGGCSTDEGPSSGATPPATASSTEGSTGGSTGSEESDPTPPAEPSGPVIEGDDLVLTLPEGYRVFERGQIATNAEDPATGAFVAFAEQGVFGGSMTLEEQAAMARRNSLTTPPPEIVDTVEVDGVEMYHLRGAGSTPDQVLDEIGARVGGSDFSLRIEVPRGIDRDAVLEAVLAGLEVRE